MSLTQVTLNEEENKIVQSYKHLRGLLTDEDAIKELIRHVGRKV